MITLPRRRQLHNAAARVARFVSLLLVSFPEGAVCEYGLHVSYLFEDFSVVEFTLCKENTRGKSRAHQVFDK